MKKLNCFLFAAVFLLATANLLPAKETPEHPLIRPYPGSVLVKNMSKYEKFGEVEFTLINKATKKKEKKKVKGKYWQLLYEVRTPSGNRVKDISKLEYFENFKNAARRAGGEILYEDAVYLHFRIPREDGGNTWCVIHTSPAMGHVYMKIIDEEGLKQSLVFGPDEMKKELDRSGRVLLYGILFDLDKSDLKEDSVKQLVAIVSLLRRNPALKLEIQGHTDKQGKPGYNLKLSQARAETVKTYLKLFGIQESRLKAKGYGETKPLASNETEAARAKNRRVELVKF